MRVFIYYIIFYSKFVLQNIILVKVELLSGACGADRLPVYKYAEENTL